MKITEDTISRKQKQDSLTASYLLKHILKNINIMIYIPILYLRMKHNYYIR